MGVDRFYIADNGSDDGTTELLSALDRAGEIRHIYFPTKNGIPPQLPAYAEIMSRHKNDVDWMAFIDADEFLFLTGQHKSIKEFLNSIEIRSANVGAIALNWATYGSSGLKRYAEENVISRFTKRAKQESEVNHHFKSIVKTLAWDGVGDNPHTFRIGSKYNLIHTSGEDVTPHDRGPGLSAKVVWSELRINHYVIKSREEFDHKRARGRATTNQLRDEKFFWNHDQNEVTEMMPAWIMEQAIAVQRNLTRKIGAIVEPRSTQSPALRVTRSSVDQANADGSIVSVRGWAVDAAGAPIADFAAKIGSHTIKATVLSRPPRPDVVRSVKGAQLNCGFELLFVIPSLADKSRSDIKFQIVGGSNVEHYEFLVGRQTVVSIGIDTVELSQAEPTCVIEVPGGNIGNQMFRFMLAWKISSQVNGSEISGTTLTEWRLAKSTKTMPTPTLKIPHGHFVDVAKVSYLLNAKIYKSISIDSFAQRLEYFSDMRQQLLEIFSNEEVGASIDDDEIAINVRSAEITSGIHKDYFPLPITFYESIIKETGLRPVFVGQIDSDRYTDALREKFPSAKFVGHNSWLKDFQTVRNAKFSVPAVSTFSWLATWLSESAIQIFFPVAGLFNPLQRPDVNLCPVSDKRYKFFNFPVLEYVGSPRQLRDLIGGSVQHQSISSNDLSHIIEKVAKYDIR